MAENMNGHSAGLADEAPAPGTSRRRLIAGATAAGIVTMSLPAVVSAASETATTTTTAAAGYSETGTADPQLNAINAVPVVTVDGNVEVSGNDTF